MLLNCGILEDSWESLGLQGDPIRSSYRRSVLSVHWKDWCWSWNSSTLPPDVNSWLRKDPDAGKDWRQEKKGTTEDDMAGWHHQLNGHEIEQASGDGKGQGRLVCCSPRDHKESDTTEQLNNNNMRHRITNYADYISRKEISPLMRPLASHFPSPGGTIVPVPHRAFQRLPAYLCQISHSNGCKIYTLCCSWWWVIHGIVLFHF